ncbi:hypothetical protein RRG08_031834 [Elysia crispata]|uniref:Uncharacterized protein n=1 Tax=Elysia crispata TaxID=231223 RepID=A0AAE0Y5N5_9GAST|nr:hypothetical protein RRG08_031834 [Elysia crispata]
MEEIRSADSGLLLIKKLASESASHRVHHANSCCAETRTKTDLYLAFAFTRLTLYNPGKLIITVWSKLHHTAYPNARKVSSATHRYRRDPDLS